LFLPLAGCSAGRCHGCSCVRKAGNSLPEGEPVSALVSAVSRPATLYAGLPSGIWQSQDAGVTWLKRSEVIATALAVHPLRADDLVIVNNDGVLQSPDGGRTWTAIANI
jgi:hypothetical protein